MNLHDLSCIVIWGTVKFVHVSCPKRQALQTWLPEKLKTFGRDEKPVEVYQICIVLQGDYRKPLPD